MKTENQIKGKKGEDAAVEHLQGKGYQILERNWRVGHLEVDIIASSDSFLVIVEVKTRKSDAFGEPEEFVDLQKQRNLIRAAAVYAERRGIRKEIRFDIISVTSQDGGFSVRHIEDAFKPRW